MSTGVYKLECEAAGVQGNKKLGELIPIEFIENLRSAELTEVLIPGEDEEGTEEFRSRYFKSFNSLAFGGNRADYTDKIKSIHGVGGVKIYRAVSDNYNIYAIIINSEFGIPSTELISSVQEVIDPTQDGDGVGMAPIGHIVHIQGVSSMPIDITTKVTLENGHIWDDVLDSINNAIDNYFLSLSQTWDSTESLIVRIAQIESKILDVIGVLDITDTQLNGTTGNLILENNQIPIRRSINADD